MSETKFTPGPWCLDGHCLTTVLKKTRDKGDPDAKHLCGDFDEIARFKTIDDARLGSVAPELYEAAKRLVAEVRGNADFPELGEAISATNLACLLCAADDVSAILAKARGES